MENISYKILLVDDEPDVLEFLGYNLEKEGYIVYKAPDGVKAVEIAAEVIPHLIILDVMMPGIDGIETCRKLRLNKELESVFIIFLSARAEDYAQIAGFEAGADDYVGKPVKLAVLKSKIKALLRRTTGGGDINEKISITDIVIDKSKYELQKAGKTIYLSKKEFELLYLLLSQPDKVFTREEIFSAVWGNNVVVGDRTIDVHIRRIREKTGIKGIFTIKGVGYKFYTNEELQS